MRREFQSLEALKRWLASDGVGRAVHVTVLHDDRCRLDMCGCSLEYVAEWLTPAVLARAQEHAGAAIRRGDS